MALCLKIGMLITKRKYYALEALRQALAQPEQGCAECGVKTSDGYALYCVKCSEPMREWVSLTEDEKLSSIWTDGSFHHGVEWAEAKLKEKNT
jgi:hypothetical protein